MKRRAIMFCTLLIMIFAPLSASALPTLSDWGFYIDGTSYYWGDWDELTDVEGLDSSSFINDLGTLTWATSMAGDHTIIAFFDYDFELDGNADDVYFDENGEAIGTPMTGQSWEIDGPGYESGDLIPNAIGYNLDTFEYSEPVGLDNENGVPAGMEDDVAFALGWDFSLLEDESATVEFVLSELLPDSLFYLIHNDPDNLGGTGESIYYSSTLTISDGGTAPVPEPSTMLLLGAGLIGLGFFSRRRLVKN